MADDPKRPRYVENADTRAMRGFRERDTRRVDSPTPPRTDPPDDDDIFAQVRIGLAKLEVHGTDQRTQLERIHARLRTFEALAPRMESLESSRKIAWGVISAVATIALGSAWGAYTAARDAGARDGRVDAHIEQLERAVDKLTNQIESLWTFRVRGAPGDLP